jgi:hypothetical protein
MKFVRLNHFSGGHSDFFFSTPEAAGRCVAYYATKAKDAADKCSGAKYSSSNDIVRFEWESPAGRIQWSAELNNVQTDDHMYP